MGGDNFRDTLPDPDPEQTLEWQEAIRAVSDALGPERAHRLLLQTIAAARQEGICLPGRFRDGEKTPWNHYVECHDDGNSG